MTLAADSTDLCKHMLSDLGMKAEHKHIACSKVSVYDVVLSEDLHGFTHLHIQSWSASRDLINCAELSLFLSTEA
jgi:hypothetical protein